jgi:hypothetical protein
VYLGRTPDPGGEDVRLDPADLRTHGVIVGMTGSGKTGLALVMLEELVAAGVPVIAIDPKGDLGNLALLVRGLQPEGFAPWVGEGEAPDTAARWREGLARWGLDAADVDALADKLDLTIYTPGATAGVPVDVLAALRRPDPAVLGDAEAAAELVADVVSGLLGLVGRDADPVRDPEHVVLSAVLAGAWQAGEDLDLAGLISRLVEPPFARVGVFPVDTYLPPKARLALALELNALLAAPSFAAWRTGAPLDVDALLTPGPRTPVSVFSIAHLDDAGRRFFLANLLGQVLAWTRRQPGTEGLRAALFFDEVAGFLPPHPADPPTKRPLLLLMKQARAVGLGVLLATQNPVDVDYKALSNAGTWLVGRLRTEQDRRRVLSGLPAADLDDTVAALPKRAFVLVRAAGSARVLATRHARCFLRGPFTRAEIGRLIGAAERSAPAQPPAPAPAGAPRAPAPAASAAVASPTSTGAAPPPLPPGAWGASPSSGAWGASPPPLPASAFTSAPSASPSVAAASTAPPPLDASMWALHPAAVHRADLAPVLAGHVSAAPGPVRYLPGLLAVVRLRFDEDRTGFVVDRRVTHLRFPLGDDPGDDALTPVSVAEEELLPLPSTGAVFAALPAWLDEPAEVRSAGARLVAAIHRGETAGQAVNTPLKLWARGDETPEAFAARCRDAADDGLAQALRKLEQEARKKLDALERKLDAARRRVDTAEGRAAALRAEEAVGAGEVLWSMFSGRRRSLTSVASRRRRSMDAGRKASDAEAAVEALEDEADALAAYVEEEAERLREDWRARAEEITVREVRLEKADIALERLGILWVPLTRQVPG